MKNYFLDFIFPLQCGTLKIIFQEDRDKKCYWGLVKNIEEKERERERERERKAYMLYLIHGQALARVGNICNQLFSYPKLIGYKQVLFFIYKTTTSNQVRTGDNLYESRSLLAIEVYA